MSNDLKVSGPIEVKIKNSSVERVAFDLMTTIAFAEDGSQKQLSRPRDYYLELYYQCLTTVRGRDSYFS